MNHFIFLVSYLYYPTNQLCLENHTQKLCSIVKERERGRLTYWSCLQINPMTLPKRWMSWKTNRERERERERDGECGGNVYREYGADE